MRPRNARDEQMAALRERLSRLSEASLRINESLELDAVLQGVLDSARSLTDARYALITTMRDTAEVEDFVVSGLTTEEAQRLWEVPERMQLFSYFSAISAPLRVPDFAAHMREMGLPDFRLPVPISSFIAAPIRHRGVSVGNIHVAKDLPGLAFTREDEETLVMFASQVALVVANARRHRDERRARADLETLIDTSPVGVAVFAMGTGAPVSFNREARRIVDGLRNPDQTTEQLLQLLTVRRADGRRISLAEFPLAQVLGTSETVRAEEIVMETAGGRSVTVLLNATPIRSDEGGVESVVVTMQDMTPLEEIERLRAEFLGMVSHELRTPLTSIRGSATTMLDATSDLDPAEIRQFLRIIVNQADHMRDLIGSLLDVARIETGTLPVSPEPVEVAVLVDRARNTFLSAGGRNALDIDLAPDLPLVMADRRRIVQVIGNLLSNAARHSPESSPLRVAAVRDGLHVELSVVDEGRGIPAERLPHLFRKFSRVEDDDQGEDTGLGLAICKGIVEAHGGRIWAESEGPGRGAVHLHRPGGRRGRGRAPPARPEPSTGGGGGAARPRGGRRSPDPPLRAKGARRCRLRPGGDRRPGGGAPPRGGEAARPGPARHDAARRRRDRADARHPRRRRRAGDLPVSLRPRRGRGAGLGVGGCRLHRQALLADRARSQGEGGPAKGSRGLPVRAAGALRAGRSDHRLSRAPGYPRGPPRAADGHRVSAALRPVGQRRACGDPRPTVATRLGPQEAGRSAGAAGAPDAAPPQAGRGREQPHLLLRRAARRLPDGEGREMSAHAVIFTPMPTKLRSGELSEGHRYVIDIGFGVTPMVCIRNEHHREDEAIRTTSLSTLGL